MASEVDLKDSKRISGGVVMSFPPSDSPEAQSSSPSKLPRRLRRRLLTESKSPSTAEEIEAKLKEAKLRRQQFHESLSSKARPKQKSGSWSSSQDDKLNRCIEAKLIAAEQKRLNKLAEARNRLMKMDELRQAAKSGVESRFEKERDELGMKVESRVQQAEANRLLILKTNRQLRAARKERIAQSLTRKMIQESKYKERVRTAIYQKRLAAERKRIGLLEAEKAKARDRLLRVRHAANLVHNLRETHRMKKKEELEERLQRAKRQRAEILKQRMGLQCSPQAMSRVMANQANPAQSLANNLTRCWKRFVSLKGTTYSLAKDFENLGVNGETVKLMPFEKLALQIESDVTLQVVESLLRRLEVWRVAKQEKGNSSLSWLENIDHLLKHVASGRRKVKSNHKSRSRAMKGDLRKEGIKSQHKLSRYQERVVLCAYMILGHPDAVLSGKRDHDNTLADSAAKFVQEFELLLNIIIGKRDLAVQSMNFPKKNALTFRSQLEAFDKAWCAYLYYFVVWKVKDAKMLEEDLVRAACQLELSMMQTCKVTAEGDTGDLTHDMKAVQKQVVEDQTLLKTKVHNLSGNAGIEHMESAISDTRSKYFAAKKAIGATSPVIHIASPGCSGSEDGSPVSFAYNHSGIANNERSGGVARGLFKKEDQSLNKVVDDSSHAGNSEGELRIGSMHFTENELLVNEIVHGHRHGFADNLGCVNDDLNRIKEKVKQTMEKAFWDGVMESVNRDDPDFSWFVKLITEVRDELCEMSPSSWKEEIVGTIDVDILSEVLASEALDMNYLGRILEFALNTLQKLSAPANDDEMRATHQKLLNELTEVSQSGNNCKSSFGIALIKGLKFVFQQIQTLKKEISQARIGLIEPLIKGPAGVEYLQKAFSGRFGPPSEARASLPLTMQWISSVKPQSEQEWEEHVNSLEASPGSSEGRQSHGLPTTALRTGGSASLTSKQHLLERATSSTGKELPECRGEKTDLLLRLGLLKLVSAIKGLTPEVVAETLKLNLYRLRSVQRMLQKVIIISTSMLVLRQALLAEHIISGSSQMELIVSQSMQKLSELLDKMEDNSISDMIQALFDVEECSSLFPDALKLNSVKEIVANMLAKSLQSGDPIFTQVSQVIYLAMRALVLGGTGSRGRALADVVLRRIGGTSLVEKLVEAADVLMVVATVSESVHGAWYDQLLKEM